MAKATHWLIYSNDLYGHMLAAIAERYVKTKHPNCDIKYWPNETRTFVTHLIMPKDITSNDTIWMLGQSPTQRGMIDIKSEIRPKKVYWYDYHISWIERIFEDKESSGIEDWPGCRTSITTLGQQMWSDLFPKEKIPPCVIWVDSHLQGKADATGKAFYRGLSLIETDPRDLSSYPEVAPEENDPSNVWEACFQVANPVDLESPKQEEEDETFTRMTWDATYQIINMGTVIDTFFRIKSQDYCSQEKFKVYQLDDTTDALLINDKDLDVSLLRDYFVSSESAVPYVGFYYVTNEDKPYFNVTIAKLPEGTSAIEVAKRFMCASGDDDIASFKTEGLVFERKNINLPPANYNNTETEND